MGAKNKHITRETQYEYVNWPPVYLVVALHLIGVVGFFHMFQCDWKTLLFNFIFLGYVQLGSMAGAHRLWSHRSYKASMPLQIFLAIAQTAGTQKSIYSWARDHRVHHKYVDTDADPYNAQRGFFFTHIAWIFVPRLPEVIEKGGKLDLSDLNSNPVVMFQKKYYNIGAPVLAFLLAPFITWYFFAESAMLSFTFGMFRHWLSVHFTFMVNSVAHIYGYRPYDSKISPTNNNIISFFTMGEGFHNYHHVFPQDYRASEYGLMFCFTTYFIKLMEKLGVAWDLRTVSKETVLARRKRTGDLKTSVVGFADPTNDEYKESEDENLPY